MAINVALKPPVAEGDPLLAAGEPPGLVPGGRGEKGDIYRQASSR